MGKFDYKCKHDLFKKKRSHTFIICFLFLFILNEMKCLMVESVKFMLFVCYEL
jgi:hypothetical protein